MTTIVTVSVPAGANFHTRLIYSPSERQQNPPTFVEPGETKDFTINGTDETGNTVSSSIVSIHEIALGQTGLGGGGR